MKAKKKPTTGSFGAIGGALPPAPTAAELAAMKKRAAAVRPKPAPKPAAKRKPAGVTGMHTRRRLAREALEG